MKRTIAVILTVVMALSLAACGQKNDVDNSVVEVSSAPDNIQEPAASQTPAVETVTVTLYTGDENAEKLIPVDCELAELTPQAIADKLCELGVFGEAITVNSFITDSANVIMLDMGKDFEAQVKNTGTAGEYIMIGSLVNSFLSAYSADGLILSVDGKTLETGHEIYDRTMVFFES